MKNIEHTMRNIVFILAIVAFMLPLPSVVWAEEPAPTEISARPSRVVNSIYIRVLNHLPVSVGLNPGGVIPCSGKGVGVSITLELTLTTPVHLNGYELQVQYDPGVLTATAESAITHTTATEAALSQNSDAVCANGACRFTAMELITPLTGTVRLGRIVLSRLADGDTNVDFSSAFISDGDGLHFAQQSTGVMLAGCKTKREFATVSGVVAIQGRVSPINKGTVTFTDLDGSYPAVTVPFSSDTGQYKVKDLHVSRFGSRYRIDVSHALYLTNRTVIALLPGDSYVTPATRILGGDVNNDGQVNLGDMAYIGSDFDGVSAECKDNSDVNADGGVNVLDLVIAGGNYGRSGPQSWTP